MFKPHYGTCTSCKQEDQLIVVKKGFCQRCNYKLKENKKKSQGKSYGYKYKRKPTGEKETFHRVLDNIPDDQPTKCFVCGVLVPVVTHHNFAHILQKGKYPLFRNKEDNIRILCYKIDGTGCHTKLDFWPQSKLTGENWERVFKLREELKEEYERISKL